MLAATEQRDFASHTDFDESILSSDNGSDAGEILIRSTRVLLPEHRYEAQTGLRSVLSTEINGKPENIKITVEKLRNASLRYTRPEKNRMMEKLKLSKSQKMTNIPPVLPGNTPLPSVSLSEEIKCTNDQNAKPAQRNEKKLPNKDLREAPSGILSSQPKASCDKGEDLLISHYAAGGKRAILAALKQRSQSTSVRQEVKVQLLNQRAALRSADPSGSSQPKEQFGASLSTEDQGTANTAAVVTAAAIAATAPLLKAQSDMEVRVSQVSESLRQLLEAADSYPGSRESRHVAGSRSSEREAQLEKQLNELTQQRLQHLEMIQSQQIELQSRLLGSALSMVTCHAPVTSITPTPVPNSNFSSAGIAAQAATSGQPPPSLLITHLDTTGGGKAMFNLTKRQSEAEIGQSRTRSRSPPETPAPRKNIPKPTSAQWGTGTHRPRQPSTSFGSGSKQQHGNQAPSESGRLREAIHDNRCSQATRAAVHPNNVAIATPSIDCQPEQISFIRHQQNAPAVSTASLSPTSHGDVAVSRANEMLQDIGRLKPEMQMLLTTHDTLPAAVGSTEPANARPVYPGPSSSVSSGLLAPLSAAQPPPPSLLQPPSVSMPAQESMGLNASGPTLSRPAPALLQRRAPAPSMFEDAERVLRQVKRNRKVLEENLATMLRANDGEVLHSQLEALSNNRDTIEEVRIKKTVDAWINALSKDIQGEVSKEEFGLLRNAKAKDSAGQDAPNKDVSVLPPQKAGLNRDSNQPSDLKGKHLSRLRPTVSQGLAGGSTGQTATHRRGQMKDQQTRPGGKLRTGRLLAQPGGRAPEAATEAVGEGEAYLMRLYGKALYEGHRRTLKKGPYLRFSSPLPKTKSPRPQVVERVRGVKVKSSKTQTSLAPDPSRHASHPVYPSPREPQYLFSPSRVTPGDPSHPHTTPLEGFLIPMAIPLGQPRVNGAAPQPSQVYISDHPMVVPTSLPSSTPAPSKASPAFEDVRSDRGCKRRVSTQLQVQVQPGVNILPPTPGPVSSPPPAVPPSHIQTMEETTEGRTEADEEEGDTIFHGADFLAVADVSQEPEAESVSSEVAIELDGLASPPAALYYGPVFPPQTAGPAQEHDPILSSIQHRETLENRLVDWVEQQLMARLISEMYHPPVADPAQNDSNVQSEAEENSVSSDIVEGAGGGGLQLFVDANVPVDSALIRQYVNEALAEAVALMLGQRDSQETDAAPANTQAPPPAPPEDVLIPTPVATPEPCLSPVMPDQQLSPLGTPEPSEHGSPDQTPRETLAESPKHSETELPQETVATPAMSPEPSPPKATPPAVPEPQRQRNNPWGDAELPLAEEEPHSHSQETQTQDSRPIVMSVAEEEPVFVTPHAPTPVRPLPQPFQTLPPPPAPLPVPESVASSPSTSTEDDSSSSNNTTTSSSSSSGSSSAGTGTDQVMKHISEGELLISYNKLAGMGAYEEGFCLPHAINSFSSSLHEVQDMDYDPPSEGQVRRPQTHDPILSLLAKMDLGVSAGLRPQPEGSWEEEGEGEESLGEVSVGQRPRLTPAEERVLTGQSLMDPGSRTTNRQRTSRTRTKGPKSRTEEAGTTETREGQVSSPGRFSQSAELTEVSLGETGRGPVTLRDLDVHVGGPGVTFHPRSPSPGMSPLLQKYSPAAEQVGARRASPILVQQYLIRGEDTHDTGEEMATQRVFQGMAVREPSPGQEPRYEEQVEEEDIEEEASVSLGTMAGADTDSSANELF